MFPRGTCLFFRVCVLFLSLEGQFILNCKSAAWFSSSPPFPSPPSPTPPSPPLWARITKNSDVSTGPLAHLFAFARSFAPLVHLLALHCLPIFGFTLLLDACFLRRIEVSLNASCKHAVAAMLQQLFTSNAISSSQ